MEAIERSVVARGKEDGGKGGTGGVQRIFRTRGTLYDTIRVDTCHYTSVKTNRMRKIKSEPLSKLWTWMIMMYQCRSNNLNKCIASVGMLVIRKSLYVWGQGA